MYTVLFARRAHLDHIGHDESSFFCDESMSNPIFPPLPRPLALVDVDGNFPVSRIFCVGRNYAAHAAEMDMPAEPIFFMKPGEAIDVDHARVPIPAHTARFDYEVELVLALGAGGRPVTPSQALECIWGAAVGVDLTRRDVQARCKSEGNPWEAAKAFDASAPISPIRRITDAQTLSQGRIWLAVNGDVRQDGRLEDMLLSPAALILALAELWTLQPGDLIFTGTPAGVGPVTGGDVVTCGVDGVGELSLSFVAPST